MYTPGTLLLWLAFLLGLASTVAYGLVIRGNHLFHQLFDRDLRFPTKNLFRL